MVVGFIVVLGTVIIWMPRVTEPQGPVWPTVMATAGLWILALMARALRRRGAGHRRGTHQYRGTVRQHRR
ncbi:MAG: hypothetical protein PF508_03605 [Spirochaeta sp.]|nr:hypothetical protein [Spirochaeta sp.]